MAIHQTNDLYHWVQCKAGIGGGGKVGNSRGDNLGAPNSTSLGFLKNESEVDCSALGM